MAIIKDEKLRELAGVWAERLEDKLQARVWSKASVITLEITEAEAVRSILHSASLPTPTK